MVLQRQRLELLRLLLERLRQQQLELVQRLPLEPKLLPMLARQRMPELLPER